MLYQELHRFYGSYIAKRVQEQLSHSEFSQVAIQELPSYLEMRAESAHKEYQARLMNPFIDEEMGDDRADFVNELCRRWREAENLAYLISAAVDAHAAFQALAVSA